MRGTVIKVSGEMAVVRTEKESYTVIELLGGCVHPGDVLEGDLDALAGETLRNLTQSEVMDVYIQSVDATPEHAAQLIS